MLTADQMRTLPEFFLDIPDPRRKQGQRHSLRVFWPSSGCGAVWYGGLQSD